MDSESANVGSSAGFSAYRLGRLHSPDTVRQCGGITGLRLLILGVYLVDDSVAPTRWRSGSSQPKPGPSSRSFWSATTPVAAEWLEMPHNEAEHALIGCMRHIHPPLATWKHRPPSEVTVPCIARVPPPPRQLPGSHPCCPTPKLVHLPGRRPCRIHRLPASIRSIYQYPRQPNLSYHCDLPLRLLFCCFSHPSVATATGPALAYLCLSHSPPTPAANQPQPQTPRSDRPDPEPAVHDSSPLYYSIRVHSVPNHTPNERDATVASLCPLRPLSARTTPCVSPRPSKHPYVVCGETIPCMHPVICPPTHLSLTTDQTCHSRQLLRSPTSSHHFLPCCPGIPSSYPPLLLRRTDTCVILDRSADSGSNCHCISPPLYQG